VIGEVVDILSEIANRS